MDRAKIAEQDARGTLSLAERQSAKKAAVGAEGVLLHTVDATIATGHEPVVILPKSTDTSPDFGTLFKAPYAVGDTATHLQGNASMTLTVDQKIGASYNITIHYTSP